MRKRSLRRWSITAAAATALAAGAVLIPATAAEARQPYVFRLCNEGWNYSVPAEVYGTTSGGQLYRFQQSLVNRGECHVINIDARFTAKVNVRAYGPGGGAYVTHRAFDTGKGLNITTWGDRYTYIPYKVT
ncbi:hypothetical protein [Streptomyces sp. NPDC020681]|uniref:hypothetical protein n=1 Tax=Streptomyces sp. NPDC020681 TaxID=3365083 RepID=UPI0037B40414